MRDATVKYTGILKLFLIIGIMIILTGFAYFFGIFEIDFDYSLIGAPVNSLYGITYLALFAFGLYLVFFSLLLLLPTLDEKSRKGLKNVRRFLVSVEIFGLILIIYSGLLTNGILPTLGLDYTWFDYFIIGVIISFLTHFFVIFSTENIQELSKFNLIWIVLVIIGIILEISSLLTYWSLLKFLGLFAIYWADQSVFGIVFLFIGGLPLLLSYKPTDNRITIGLGVLSLILIISGIITYLAPTLALNGLLIPLSIFEYNKYHDYLFFGSILLIVGICIASNLEGIQKYLKKFSVLWILLLFSGFLQFLTSILMEITDTYFIDLGLDFLFNSTTRGSVLFDMTWNVFLINAFITTLPVLIIFGSIIFKESNLALKGQNPEDD